MKSLVCGLAVVVVCLTGRPVSAESILFTGSGAGASSVTLNASAFFDISGANLTITLSNLGDTSGTGSSSDSSHNQLSGLFFDLPNGITLTPVSATINPGSIVQTSYCNTPSTCASTTNVGGEFRYQTGSYPNSADRGISSAGQLGYHLAPNFNGTNLDNPTYVDGANFLIIAPQTGTNTFSPDSTINTMPLIEGSVEFAMTIAGGTGTLTAADLQNVSFEDGTSSTNILGNKPSGGSVPEPATALIALSGIAVAVRRSSRTRARRTQPSA